MPRPFALIAVALLVGGCVSVEEAPLAVDAIHAGQPTVVVVFASPGPVMTENDSTTEQVAKLVPGMSFLISATQNRRDLEASEKLRDALPLWRPDDLFLPVASQELANTGFPGRFVLPTDVGLSTEALQGLNRAGDVIDWQVRYYTRSNDNPAPRDYASLPPLRDALVLEINLVYAAPSDGHGNETPTLSCVTKLVNGADKRLLWRREDAVSDKPGTRAAALFRKQPADLIVRWQALMPALAGSLAAGLRGNLQQADAFPSAPR